MPSASASAQCGYAMSEYLIGTAILTVGLFAPLPGFDVSAFEFLVDSLIQFQANTTYLMSMP